MTVLKSHISWCTGTLNLAVGCHKVSPGGQNCYAEQLVHRLWDRPFEDVVLHPERVKNIPKFKPSRNQDGQLEPPMIFVNSMSDFYHPWIGTDRVDEFLDVFEQHPTKVFQILTKRPERMRKHLRDRYARRSVPDNLWFGPSVESNQLKGRLRMMRRLKEEIGDFCAFASVEPIIGPTDELDFSGMDWILTGGESGPRCRPMEYRWLSDAHDEARRVGAAVHFKQWGAVKNNPLVRQRMFDAGVNQTTAWRQVVDEGLERQPDEKGGATIDGQVFHEKPAAFYRVMAQLNGGQAQLSV